METKTENKDKIGCVKCKEASLVERTSYTTEQGVKVIHFTPCSKCGFIHSGLHTYQMQKIQSGMTEEQEKEFKEAKDSESKMKHNAQYKAREIKDNLKQYNIPESVDRASIANDVVSEVLNDLKEWGIDDWHRGKRIEFWEEVQRNL